MHGKNWAEWWRCFLDIAPDRSLEALDVLRQRYVEEMQQADRFEQSAQNGNSWKSLLTAIEDENRSADHLPEQLRSIGLDHPDIAQLLQKIPHEAKTHRDEIREMLMRSDPFALSLA